MSTQSEKISHIGVTLQALCLALLLTSVYIAMELAKFDTDGAWRIFNHANTLKHNMGLISTEFEGLFKNSDLFQSDTDYDDLRDICGLDLYYISTLEQIRSKLKVCKVRLSELWGRDVQRMPEHVAESILSAQTYAERAKNSLNQLAENISTNVSSQGLNTPFYKFSFHINSPPGAFEEYLLTREKIKLLGNEVDIKSAVLFAPLANLILILLICAFARQMLKIDSSARNYNHFFLFHDAALSVGMRYFLFFVVFILNLYSLQIALLLHAGIDTTGWIPALILSAIAVGLTWLVNSCVLKTANNTQ